MSDSGVVAAAALALPIVVGFVVTALATRPLIGWLQRRQLGKAFREDGPSHQGKAGTPTMGGVAVVGTILLTCALAAAFGHRTASSRLQALGGSPDLELTVFDASMVFRVSITLLIATAAFGAIGLLDDWQGLSRKGKARAMGIGLTARRALALQFVIAVGIAYSLARAASGFGLARFTDWPEKYHGSGSAASSLLHQLTVLPHSVVNSQSLAAWIGIAALVIVGTVNAVNLSDGLDGLAAGLCAIAFLALGLVVARLALTTEGLSRIAFPNMWSTAMAVISLLIAGACLGFLVHNRYPARVFMGNVTSMALGGAMATIALATGTWLLLPVIGIVYVAEVVSDIIQIGYFKWTGGKRFFRMAPLHHHFELLGMHETAVTRRFWLAGAIGAAVAVGFVYYATWGV